MVIDLHCKLQDVKNTKPLGSVAIGAAIFSRGNWPFRSPGGNYILAKPNVLPSVHSDGGQKPSVDCELEDVIVENPSNRRAACTIQHIKVSNDNYGATAEAIVWKQVLMFH